MITPSFSLSAKWIVSLYDPFECLSDSTISAVIDLAGYPLVFPRDTVEAA